MGPAPSSCKPLGGGGHGTHSDVLANPLAKSLAEVFRWPRGAEADWDRRVGYRQLSPLKCPAHGGLRLLSGQQLPIPSSPPPGPLPISPSRLSRRFQPRDIAVARASERRDFSCMRRSWQRDGTVM